MNTNQVMPMAGGVQVSRKAPVAAARDRGMAQGKSDSFNDVLAKSKHNGSKEDSLTLQDVKDLAKSAQAAEEEAKLAEAVKSAGTEAETPKNTKNGEDNSAKMASASKEAPKTVEGDDVEIDINVDIDMADVAVNPLSAVVASHDIEGNFADVAEEGQAEFKLVPKEAQNYNLQTILPQSGEASAKHTEMLQMLSGQFVPKNQDAVKQKVFNPNDMGFMKASAELKEAGNQPQNPDIPQFVQKMPTDPLSAMASDMARFKNVDVIPSVAANANANISANVNVNGVENANVNANPNANVKVDVNVNTNVSADVDVKVNVDVNTADKIGVTVENLSNEAKEIDLDGEAVLTTKPKDAPVMPEMPKGTVNEAKADAAQQPNPENVALKAQPLAANAVVQDKSATQPQGNNPLAGVTIEVEDGEVVPPPQCDNFEQEMTRENNGERQPLFDERRNDVFRLNEGVKNNVNEGRGQIEPQTFASHIESQNNTNAAPNTRESAPLPQAPRDDFNVRGQIVEQARLVRQENGTEMVIRLKPEHLGNLTLRISVSSEGAVTASFFTNNHEVRNIVENSLVQLRQELQNQGLKVDKTEVYSGLSDGSLPQGQGQEAWQQNGRGSSRGGFRNAENDALAFEDASTNAAEQGADVGAADGVDYLV